MKVADLNIERASQAKAYYVETLLQDAAFPIGQSPSADERREEFTFEFTFERIC